MRISIVILLLLVVFEVKAQAPVYQASNFTVSNKPYGVPRGPDGARSYYYDVALVKLRPYKSVSEALAYVQGAARTGHFPLYINVGGTLNANGTFTGGEVKEYWFKNGTADSDLVEKTTSVPNTYTEPFNGTTANAFTVSRPPIPASIAVYVNGVRLPRSVWTVTVNTVAINAALLTYSTTTADTIEIEYQSTF